MKALRFHAAKDLRIEDVPEPSVQPGTVKVKVDWCGICGTDLHEYKDGPIFCPSPGHPHPISGEDAPELVATAPVGPDAVIRAKMEAVLGGTFIVVIPLILPIAFLDMRAGAVALFAVCAATMSSTAIQFWFRSQAKRSSFRRRHTSSRIATFAEAFSSILWSGMAALWIAGGVLLAVPFALIIGALLLLVRKLSPKGVN